MTRARRILTKLVVVVGLPTLVATIYFSFIASDIYESTAVIMVQSASGWRASGSKATLGNVSRGNTAKDSITIKKYILSRDMLALLEEEHQISAHYSQEQADWWSRLTTSPTLEETYAYFKKQVEVSIDTDSGVLTLTVRAYSSEMAKSITQSLLSLSEEKVNTLTARAREDQVEFAKKDVQQAEQRLTKAQKAVSKLQSELAELPSEQPDGEIRASRVKLEAELESALMEKTMADKQYLSAMSSLEMAKVEATRQSRYLSIIASPSSPDDATHPKRILGVVTVLFASLALFGILSLLVAAVREHARM
jgi:capsular polysaccharide transport system permease protein